MNDSLRVGANLGQIRLIFLQFWLFSSYLGNFLFTAFSVLNLKRNVVFDKEISVHLTIGIIITMIIIVVVAFKPF